MRKKIEHISIMISMGIIVAVWFLLMFWWLYPYKTTSNIQPYKILNEEVRQGDLLLYKIDYCKYTNVTPTVNRQFIDGIIYSTPESTAQLKKGCGRFINSVKIPTTLPPGTYYMKATVTFKMNPIRIISKEFITEQFTVLKK